MKYSPIALFAYNRPNHLRQTVDALCANDLARKSQLFVFSDAHKSENDRDDVEKVRKYIRAIKGFANVDIIERKNNYGLADSIVEGVTTLIEKYGRVIVVEDDLVTSPFFLRYMNEALDRYADDERVMHIAAYMPSIDIAGLPESFFLRNSSCWGWATWQRAWKYFSRNGKRIVESFDRDTVYKFNLDGAYDYWSQLIANEQNKLKTWAVYWYACVFERGGLCLHPRESLVMNTGFDGSGVNCGDRSDQLSSLSSKLITYFPIRSEDFIENQLAVQRLQRYLKVKTPKTLFKPHGILHHLAFLDRYRLKALAIISFMKRLKKYYTHARDVLISKDKRVKLYLKNGAKPWSFGYNEYKWKRIKEIIEKDDFENLIGTVNYGYRLDERVVEIPWFFSRIDAQKDIILDAGSALNYEPLINHPKLASKRLIISTLAPEGQAFWASGISYIYEDLRTTCLKEDYFDLIACISTIEHVGLDNTFLYTDDISKNEQKINDYLHFLDVIRSLLRRGGRLFLSFPFGRKKNNGWFQVFDGGDIDGMIARFNPAFYIESIYMYQDDHWRHVGREDAAGAICYDINIDGKHAPDYCAFSRAVACLELVK